MSSDNKPPSGNDVSGDDKLGARTIISSSGSSRGDDFGAKTKLIGGAGGGAKSRPASIGRPQNQTRIGGATPSNKTQLMQNGSPGSRVDAEASIELVVGWLVIESGPGRGKALQIGVGMNSVGRGADQRMRLDFGDNMISSEKHFLVSFDPKSKTFALHRGDGANLVYLEGEPVYSSEELQNFVKIEVGQTRLRFVALCGDAFSWDDETD